MSSSLERGGTTSGASFGFVPAKHGKKKRGVQRKPGVVGANVRRIRKLKRPRMSMDALAEKAGVHRQTISNIELGYVEEPDLTTVRDLATALEVHELELLQPVGQTAMPAWLAAFDDSYAAKALDPNLTVAEREWLLSIPSATWAKIPPEPKTLAAIIEDRRRKHPPAPVEAVGPPK